MDLFVGFSQFLLIATMVALFLLAVYCLIGWAVFHKIKKSGSDYAKDAFDIPEEYPWYEKAFFFIVWPVHLIFVGANKERVLRESKKKKKSVIRLVKK